MKLANIKPYKDNAKMHDRVQINNVAQSIREFGFVQPIVVDRDGVVIIGHCRLLALKQLGYDEIPDDWVKTLDADEDRVKKLRLLDNKLNESDWDIDLLARQIPELDFSSFDLDWGLPELADDLPEKTEDDYTEPVDLPSFVKRGEVWQLGEHRLMCGDSTDAQDVETLMGGASADLCVTDPPYNVNYTGTRPGRPDARTIANDNMADDEFLQFLLSAFRNLKTALKSWGVFYVWHAHLIGHKFRRALDLNDLETRQCLIWVKSNFAIGHFDYHWKHKACFYGWKDGAAHYFIDDRSQSNVFEDKIDLRKLKKPELLKLLEEVYGDTTSTTVLHEQMPRADDLHPTMKPVKLFARQIKNSSLAGQIVLDLFGGSGTTIIACEELKRRAYVMEYDEHYASVIIDRWQQFTNQVARRID